MSFFSTLFATTDVEKLRKFGTRKILRRALTAKDLIAIGLGTMIGGGIFTTIGTGVKGAGPAVIVSYLLAGLTSFFAALCYAELGAMVPVAGSAYTYAYATMGKLFAWIIGFALIFEYGISAAPVAQQFSAAIQDVAKSAGLLAAGLGATVELDRPRGVVASRRTGISFTRSSTWSRRSSSSRSRRCSPSEFANRRR